MDEDFPLNHPSLWQEYYPKAKPENHKYDFGHVVILGGSEYVGAAKLSSVAALRIGAGLVTIAAPADVWSVYASWVQSVMTVPIEDIDAFDAFIEDDRKNTFLVGPGAGASDYTRQCVLAALGKGRTTIIDADGLNVFEGDHETLAQAISGPTVITPHEGEFSRLFASVDLGESRHERASSAAQLLNATVVLKGYQTLIASPDGSLVMQEEAPGVLATAGTGDVLAGMIAGLAARGMPVEKASSMGVWLHTAIAKAVGYGLLAEDIATHVPAALKGLYSYSK